MQVLTQKEMNEAGCGIPNCGHDHSILLINSRCHPGGSTRVHYIKSTGIITLNCAICDELVVGIKVASD